MKGTIKAIPIPEEELKEGMQVLCYNKVGKIVKWGEYIIWNSKADGSGVNNSYQPNLFEYKKLVVEYEGKQYPLKYSQWASALANDEIDSDKEVEFEIKRVDTKEVIDRDPMTDYPVYGDIQIAKIIPQKKKFYTEEQVITVLEASYIRGYQDRDEDIGYKSNIPYLKELFLGFL